MPQDLLIKQLEYELMGKCLLGDDFKSGILVGLSGGPDSVFLLHALTKIIPRGMLMAAHLNHGLRGTESEEDEKYCTELCNLLEIPIVIQRKDVHLLSKKMKIGLEECGRILRYSFFEEERIKAGFKWIAVAHNKKDQAETILMNIVRGCGLTGLKGMSYISGSIIRPMLGVERTLIEEYCLVNNLKPRIDSSNLSQAYTRNRVRLEGIPLLNKIFDQNVENQLVKLSKNMKDISDYLDIQANQEYFSVCTNLHESAIKIDVKSFNSLHPAISTAILRIAVGKVCGSIKGFGNVHFDALHHLFNSKVSGKSLNLPCDLVAQYAYGEILLTTNKVKFEDAFFIKELVVPGQNQVKDFRILTSLQKKEESFEKYWPTNKIVYVNCGKIEHGLTIRSRQQGDKISPWKSNGTRKLKEYFIDNKIPRQERDEILVIADGENIVWIIGIEFDKRFLVQDETRNIIKIELVK